MVTVQRRCLRQVRLLQLDVVLRSLYRWLDRFSRWDTVIL